jgi:hypothetical protein
LAQQQAPFQESISDLRTGSGNGGFPQMDTVDA